MGRVILTIPQLKKVTDNISIGYHCKECNTDFYTNIQDCTTDEEDYRLIAKCPACKTIWSCEMPPSQEIWLED